MANSRMKDYFDLWILLSEDDLDPIQLRHSITATLARRQTPPLDHVPAGLTDDCAMNTGKQAQWRAFLRKNKLEPIALNDVVQRLRSEFQKIRPVDF